jgi:hypothetical protein
MARRLARFAAAVLPGVLALSLAAAPAFADQPLIVGFATSINDPLTVYPVARSLGAQSVRVDAPWKTIETTRGHYALPAGLDNRLKAIAAAGLEPLLILDYGNPLYAGGDKPRDDEGRKAYADYATWLVGTLKGRVRWFELWNEWEAKTGGAPVGTPEEYAALARATVPRLRQANPLALILTAGMSYPAIKTDYFDRFLRTGTVSLFDGISIHPYADGLKRDWSPEREIALLDDLQARVQKVNGGRPKDFYITEMGFSNFRSGFGYNPRVIGAYVKRFVLLADTRPWIRGVWWYQLRDQGHDPGEREQNFGVLDERLNPKPAATAFSEVVKALGTSRGQVRTVGSDIVYQSGDGRAKAKWRDRNPATGEEFPRNGDEAERALGEGADPVLQRGSN